MKVGLVIGMVALSALLGTDPARADWVEDAWSEDSVRMNGNPAVSISRGAVHVVLPAMSLHQAYEEGLTTRQILRAFLDRHAQRCSDVLDLNVPHPNLRVALSLQGRMSFDDIPEQDEVLTALKEVYRKQGSSAGAPMLFTVSPVQFELSIDYVPTRRVRCILPTGGDANS